MATITQREIVTTIFSNNASLISYDPTSAHDFAELAMAEAEVTFEEAMNVFETMKFNTKH